MTSKFGAQTSFPSSRKGKTNQARETASVLVNHNLLIKLVVRIKQILSTMEHKKMRYGTYIAGYVKSGTRI